MMTIKTRVEANLIELNLMSGRVPFTHHHDYVRTHTEIETRSQAARLNTNEDELWACSFLMAVSYLSDEQKICLEIDEALYRDCLAIANTHIEDINREMNLGVYR